MSGSESKNDADKKEMHGMRSSQSPSPNRRDFIKFQTFSTAFRRLHRILRRWLDADLTSLQRHVMITLQAHCQLSKQNETITADNLGRGIVVSDMQRLNIVLHMVMGVLEADTTRYFLKEWARTVKHFSSLADQFLEERQVPINRRLAEAMSVRLELATHSCLDKEDELREEEVEASEMLAWILRAIRTDKLDLCRDAWERMLGHLDAADMRLAMLNWVERWKLSGGKRVRQKRKGKSFYGDTTGQKSLWKEDPVEEASFFPSLWGF